jgi:hypothetical protein
MAGEANAEISIRKKQHGSWMCIWHTGRKAIDNGIEKFNAMALLQPRNSGILTVNWMIDPGRQTREGGVLQVSEAGEAVVPRRPTLEKCHGEPSSS